MPLTLVISNVERLDNGVSTRLVLDRHGAVIGRSPQADWSLPDPQHYISSTHCEIDFRDGVYVLTDKSTNGTFVNGASARPEGPHTVRNGDHILIGAYDVAAQLDPEAEAAAEALTGVSGARRPGQTQGLASGNDWGGWESHGRGAPPPPPAGDDWGRPAAPAAISGAGPMSGRWSPDSTVGLAPAAAPSAAPAASSSGWGAPPQAAAPAAASAWSSPIAETKGDPAAADIWGKLAEGNVVDWARGGFGAQAEPVLASAPAKDPLGLGGAGRDAAEAWGQAPAASQAGGSDWGAPSSNAAARTAPNWGPSATGASAAAAPSAPPAASTPASGGWGAPTEAARAPVAATLPPRAAPAAVPAQRAAPAPAAAPGGEWAAFLEAAGLETRDVRTDPRAALASAGTLLRRLVAGMVVMMEARARAKAQLGAQGTMLELQGNNPLKFARTPEKALAQLLNPAERGFMGAEQAIEDGFRDLQAHQMATLAAMQGALGATLARFSPQSIRERAEMRGMLAKIIPSARDATLWKAYEREFEGVARGSDEAFMDVFAKEFKAAYENAAAGMKDRR
ncbi:MAG TPA: type VI secretion system-associated FHA domain protein TagH [Caulobacteraceae bacterium]|jgi:type VI secretion system FHA domain protein|nr:type VI secretion system-associated FHA domain protein TagH [Caulobacteraceae bacterium]